MDPVVVEVTREALLSSYPDEVEDLDAALERIEREGRSRVRPPVGMGVDMLPLADYVLPAVAALLGAVGGALAEQASAVVSERTKAGLARLRGHAQDPFVPLAPEQEEEVCAAVVLMLQGKVTPEEAATLGLAVVGALRLRRGGTRD
ncbi:hypothetical protein ACFVZ8_07435 [Streptomyces sp. NPDC059558]|uniref:hypothetical protein n=1 Tax=unclassified Streptomyces TaxID=2593676 RepID=UPI0009C22CB5|nr:hypothetical protein [Streptomyces sp. Sge12]ARE78454.1 hypothetical protein B6R96_34700 [Streptomyces sp. Sge12]